MNAAQLEQEAYARLSDIPPVTCCARCGLPSCEGCAVREVSAQAATGLDLPWVIRAPSLTALFDTALTTSIEASSVFSRLRGTAPRRALAFALLVELLALASIAAAALLGLFAVAPRLALDLLRHGSTWLAGAGLWFVTAAVVTLFHVLWAELLERGVARAGGERSRGLALEFAGYSCGWDLLTSPLGVWLSLRSGAERGEGLASGRWRAILLALRAPRPAMQAYLRECRGLDEVTATAVVRRAGRDAVAIVIVATCLAVGGVIGLLLATWPR